MAYADYAALSQEEKLKRIHAVTGGPKTVTSPAPPKPAPMSAPAANNAVPSYPVPSQPTQSTNYARQIAEQDRNPITMTRLVDGREVTFNVKNDAAAQMWEQQGATRVGSAPQYTYYDAPSSYGYDSQGRPLTEQQWLGGGGLLDLSGKNELGAYKTLDGRFLDTTNMTAQQIHAAMLWDEVAAGKRTAESAAAALKGMGIDAYGNAVNPLYQGNSVYFLPGTSGSLNQPMSAQAASGTTKVLSMPQGSVPQGTFGSNISNFNPNDPLHIALAEAGQQWSEANRKGDAAGMEAAARRGEQIRQQMGGGAAFDPTTGMTTAPLGTTVSQPISADASRSVFEGFSYDQLQQEAARQAEQERLSKQRAMETALSLLGASKNRLFQNINEDRILQNVQLDDSLSPFSGRSDYARGMIGLQRERTDREINQDYAQRAMQAQQGYTDFLSGLNEYEQQLMNDLLRREREYGLQYGGLMGQLPGGGQTLAGQQQAWNQQMDLADRTGQLPGGQQTLAGRQFDANEAQRQWENTFKEKQWDFTTAQQLWENTFQEKNFEQSMKQFSQRMGLDWAQLNQRQKEFVAEQAFREKSLDLEREKFESSRGRGNKAEDYFKIINDSIFVSPEITMDEFGQQTRTGRVTVNDPDGLERFILSLGLPDAEARKLYYHFGIGDRIQ